MPSGAEHSSMELDDRIKAVKEERCNSAAHR